MTALFIGEYVKQMMETTYSLTCFKLKNSVKHEKCG